MWSNFVAACTRAPRSTSSTMESRKRAARRGRHYAPKLCPDLHPNDEWVLSLECHLFGHRWPIGSKFLDFYFCVDGAGRQRRRLPVSLFGRQFSANSTDCLGLYSKTRVTTCAERKRTGGSIEL